MTYHTLLLRNYEYIFSVSKKLMLPGLNFGYHSMFVWWTNLNPPEPFPYTASRRLAYNLTIYFHPRMYLIPLSFLRREAQIISRHICSLKLNHTIDTWPLLIVSNAVIYCVPPLFSIVCSLVTVCPSRLLHALQSAHVVVRDSCGCTLMTIWPSLTVPLRDSVKFYF